MDFAWDFLVQFVLEFTNIHLLPEYEDLFPQEISYFPRASAEENFIFWRNKSFFPNIHAMNFYYTEQHMIMQNTSGSNSFSTFRKKITYWMFDFLYAIFFLLFHKFESYIAKLLFFFCFTNNDN